MLAGRMLARETLENELDRLLRSFVENDFATAFAKWKKRVHCNSG